VFRRNPATGNSIQEQKIPFGEAVAVNGDDLFVGKSSSSAHAYRYIGGTWVHQQELLSPEPDPGAFGVPATDSGPLLIWGTAGQGRDAISHGYLYQQTGDAWVLFHTLTASDAQPGEGIAQILAMADGYAIFGAPGDDSACPKDPFCGSGAAYLYVVVDCNHNGIADKADIAEGRSADCNANHAPDECDLRDCSGAPHCADCNANTVPDGCEPDCDLNGLPNECDGPCVGACCDHDPFHGCLDDIPQAECACPNCQWTANALCDEVICARDAIPAVSTWGLAVLALSLLIGAKLRFGHGQSEA